MSKLVYSQTRKARTEAALAVLAGTATWGPVALLVWFVVDNQLWLWLAWGILGILWTLNVVYAVMNAWAGGEFSLVLTDERLTIRAPARVLMEDIDVALTDIREIVGDVSRRHAAWTIVTHDGEELPLFDNYGVEPREVATEIQRLLGRNLIRTVGGESTRRTIRSSIP